MEQAMIHTDSALADHCVHLVYKLYLLIYSTHNIRNNTLLHSIQIIRHADSKTAQNDKRHKSVSKLSSECGMSKDTYISSESGYDFGLLALVVIIICIIFTPCFLTVHILLVLHTTINTPLNALQTRNLSSRTDLQTHASSAFDNCMTQPIDLSTSLSKHVELLPWDMCVQSLVLIAQAVITGTEINRSGRQENSAPLINWSAD